MGWLFGLNCEPKVLFVLSLVLKLLHDILVIDFLMNLIKRIVLLLMLAIQYASDVPSRIQNNYVNQFEVYLI
jgi:hypothetical protein